MNNQPHSLTNPAGQLNYPVTKADGSAEPALGADTYIDRLAILEKAHADLVSAFFERTKELNTRLDVHLAEIARANGRIAALEKFLGPKQPY